MYKQFPYVCDGWAYLRFLRVAWSSSELVCTTFLTCRWLGLPLIVWVYVRICVHALNYNLVVCACMCTCVCIHMQEFVCTYMYIWRCALTYNQLQRSNITINNILMCCLGSQCNIPSTVTTQTSQMRDDAKYELLMSRDDVFF